MDAGWACGVAVSAWWRVGGVGGFWGWVDGDLTSRRVREENGEGLAFGVFEDGIWLG